MKITTQWILLCVGLVTLTGLGIAYFVYDVTRKTVEQEVMGHLAERAAAYMQEIDHMLFERLGDIQIMVSDPLLCAQDLDRQRIMNRFVQYLDTFKIYTSLSYLAKDGVILIDSSNQGIGHPPAPDSFIGQTWQAMLMAPYTIDVGFSESQQKEMLYFAKPVRCPGDREGRGLVLARVELSRLHGWFPAAKLARDRDAVEIHLIDQRGSVIYANHPFKPDQEQERQHFVLRDVEENFVLQTRSSGYPDFQGSPWTLMIFVPKQVALVNVMDLRDRIIAISLMGIGLAILLTLLLTRHFDRTIRTLMGVTREISEGNLYAYTEVIRNRDSDPHEAGSRNEFALLSRSFDEMVLKVYESQKRLQDAMELNQKIFASSHYGILAYQYATGQCVLANNAAGLLLGLPVQELLEENLTDVDAWQPRMNLLQLADARLSVAEDLQEDLVIENHQGVSVWLHVVCSTFVNQGESHLLFMMNDISHRRQVEEAILHAKAAEAANHSKSAFLANMSHEIRTPMNAVIGLTDLALQNELPPQTRSHLTKIKTASHSLLRIVDDILDFSKIDAGKLALESLEFLLSDVIDAVEELFSNHCAQKNLVWNLFVDPACRLMLIGDALRLQQVLINLVGNAIKFTQEGAVTVRVQLAEALHDSVILQFEIQDTGIGLSQQQIAGLFHPFVQGDSSTTRRFGGTGLGLVICKRLVELLGGRIWVKSAPGQGSRFFFTAEFIRSSGTLPGAQETQTRHALAHGFGDLAGVRVLLVEDNALNREVARGVLEKVGMCVEEAHNGQEAVRMVAQTRYDAVLMDLQMPVMDGLMATRHIRREHPDLDLPIIAMTANVLESDREKSLLAGMNDFVPKPIRQNHLYATLAQWIQKGDPSGGAPPTPQPESTGETMAPFMLDGLDVQEALRERFGGDVVRYKAFLQVFLRDYEGVAATMRAALRQEEISRVIGEVHTMKGLAGTLSANELMQQAAILEQKLKQGPLTPEAGCWMDFERALARVMAAIHTLEPEAERREEPVAAPLDKSRIAPLLMELAGYLADRDTQALTTLGVLREWLRGPELQQDVQALEDGIKWFDYEGARAHLESIARILDLPLESS